MQNQIRSLRPFIGAADYDQSRKFYIEVGFTEIKIDENLTFFSLPAGGFYLQRAYVKDWIDNTMLFLEVAGLKDFWMKINELRLPQKFKKARLVPIRDLDWGSEFFLYDPSGILWHIGEFKKRQENI
jgi:hypothetical protein